MGVTMDPEPQHAESTEAVTAPGPQTFTQSAEHTVGTGATSVPGSFEFSTTALPQQTSFSADEPAIETKVVKPSPKKAPKSTPAETK